jgi:hypothetical protein
MIQTPNLGRDHAPQDREQLRPAQGLAAGRNTLRQVPEGLPVSMRLGCRRHVLVMNPDPKVLIHIYNITSFNISIIS